MGGGGFHPIMKKKHLNLHPPMPFLSIQSSLFASPDHRAHWLCRLVENTLVLKFPMGKRLRYHFMKPPQGSLLSKSNAEI